MRSLWVMLVVNPTPNPMTIVLLKTCGGDGDVRTRRDWSDMSTSQGLLENTRR